MAGAWEHREVEFKCLDFLGFSDYFVGDDGSVWSNKYRRWKRLKQSKRNGYLFAVFSNGSREKVVNRFVHRLVLEAFVGPCPKGMECCHNDGDPTNNNLSNLRWDTRKANSADRKKHGTDIEGTKNKMAKLDDDKVREMRRLREEGWSFSRLARYYQVDIKTVFPAVHRRTWKHVV